jgi:beta-glucanase (GH16 family)
MTTSRADLARACDLALADDWAGAHAIVQADEEDPAACWIHAVLHKIEGDVANARYWYGRAGQHFESYPEPSIELRTIKATLTY